MNQEEQLERRCQEWRDLSAKRAEACGKMEYVREYRKSLLAMLATQAPDGSEAARERWARSHPDYLAHLRAIEHAVTEFQKLDYDMQIAFRRSQIWQSIQAGKRAEREQYRT